jgi:hypothetical protein
MRFSLAVLLVLPVLLVAGAASPRSAAAHPLRPLISFSETQLAMWPQWSVNKFLRSG